MPEEPEDFSFFPLLSHSLDLFPSLQPTPQLVPYPVPHLPNPLTRIDKSTVGLPNGALFNLALRPPPFQTLLGTVGLPNGAFTMSQDDQESSHSGNRLRKRQRKDEIPSQTGDKLLDELLRRKVPVVPGPYDSFPFPRMISVIFSLHLCWCVRTRLDEVAPSNVIRILSSREIVLGPVSAAAAWILVPEGTAHHPILHLCGHRCLTHLPLSLRGDYLMDLTPRSFSTVELLAGLSRPPRKHGSSS